MARKLRTTREETEQMLRAAFEKIKAEGQPIGVTEFVKLVGIDRTYFYSFRTLAAEVSAYASKTQPEKSLRGPRLALAQASEREEIETIKREHSHWAKEVPGLREALSRSALVIEQQKAQIATLQIETTELRAAYEHLLLRAFQDGVEMQMIEKYQAEVVERLGHSLGLSMPTS